jgi:4-diphosphocytidyl-2C-methyl-D-erythritol kinase
MGGSSSLIAGLIVAINSEFSLGLNYEQMCAWGDEFGSDVAFMIRGGAGRIKGRSRVNEFFSVAPIDALVVRKGFSDTKKVFAKYDESPHVIDDDYNDSLVRKLKNGRIDWVFSAHNDLTDSAVLLNPYIGDALSAYPGAFMTGSGSGVVCAFASEKVRADFEAQGYECYSLTIGDFRTEVSTK